LLRRSAQGGKVVVEAIIREVLPTSIILKSLHNQRASKIEEEIENDYLVFSLRID
jgi:hypothetical protein